MNGLVRASRFGSEELEERFVCRSAALRGLVDAIERSSHAAAIFGRLSASTRQKLARLPPAWAMTSAMPFQELLGATAEECGERGVEQLAAASLKTGMLRFVGPLIRGLGRSGRLPPLQLFGQLVKILPSHLRGIDLELQSLGERELVLRVDYRWLESAPESAFAYWRGLLRALAQTAGHEIEIQQSASEARGRALAAMDLRILW